MGLKGTLTDGFRLCNLPAFSLPLSYHYIISIWDSLTRVNLNHMRRFKSNLWGLPPETLNESLWSME